MCSRQKKRYRAANIRAGNTTIGDKSRLNTLRAAHPVYCLRAFRAA